MYALHADRAQPDLRQRTAPSAMSVGASSVAAYAVGGWFRRAACGWLRTAAEAARPGWGDESAGAG
ncbi:hypothetical protein ADL28_12570 [Streptomyces violaceusniger]|uniref:Uncharacterized protein n=1 Tax=Streptomyces violaceusniger TaxID=68280 RepID=A0A0X3X216_STRVO|nr:hypothetical protein ADL28_12570 [Streptomyces violaceusniger]